MDILIKQNSKYSEVVIKDGNVTIESGLLDDAEKRELAIAFLNAATELIEDIGSIFGSIY